LKVARAQLTNILEEPTAGAAVVAKASGGESAIKLAFKPFEIVTVKLTLKA
ncbi:hypothetical protein H4R19_007094, partial [Coemansia spiralis]